MKGATMILNEVSIIFLCVAPQTLFADETTYRIETPVAVAYLNDLTIFSHSGGGWNSFDTYPRLLGDVDGDGKDDIIGFGYSTVSVSISTGVGFEYDVSWLATEFTYGGGDWTQSYYPRTMGDVDGDGKDDVIGFGYYDVKVSLSNGASFDTSSSWLTTDFTVGSGGWSTYDEYPRMIADVNGDGKDDIIGFGSSSVMVSLSTGSSFQSSSSWMTYYFTKTQWSSYETYPRAMGDVNGDGKADIIGFGDYDVVVSLSTGSGFSSPVVWYSNGFTQYGGGWLDFDGYPRMIADVDGDGKDDLIGFAYDGVQVSFSDGSSFGSVYQYSNLLAQTTGWSSYDSYPRAAGDVSGDGMVDIVGFGYSTVMHIESAFEVNCAYGCFVNHTNRTNVSVLVSDIDACYDYSFCSGAEVGEEMTHTVPYGKVGTVYGFDDAFDSLVMDNIQNLKCVDTAIAVACKLKIAYTCKVKQVNKLTGGLVSEAFIKSTEIFGKNDVSKTIKHCNSASGNSRTTSISTLVPWLTFLFLLYNARF